ncbi:MAG: hypothetical protein MUP16_11000 [Sedimentisphaerales bacterium]|nr:hypothetical protein [Sedimentisphaerales bacterium]
MGLGADYVGDFHQARGVVAFGLGLYDRQIKSWHKPLLDAILPPHRKKTVNMHTYTRLTKFVADAIIERSFGFDYLEFCVMI